MEIVVRCRNSKRNSKRTSRLNSPVELVLDVEVIGTQMITAANGS